VALVALDVGAQSAAQHSLACPKYVKRKAYAGLNDGMRVREDTAWNFTRLGRNNTVQKVAITVGETDRIRIVNLRLKSRRMIPCLVPGLHPGKARTVIQGDPAARLPGVLRVPLDVPEAPAAVVVRYALLELRKMLGQNIREFVSIVLAPV